MSANHSTKWYWSDWLGDQAVRNLTLAERGLWIDLLALAAIGSPIGYVSDAKGRPLTLDEIARVTNAASPDEVAKLVAGITKKGAASRDRAGRLFNRRMVREAEISAKRSAAGRVGAAHTKLSWQGFRPLPQQMPQQMPQQNVSANRDARLKKKDFYPSSSSVQAAARARDGPVIPLETHQQVAWPQEGVAEGEHATKPHQATRAEIEASFQKKRERQAAKAAAAKANGNDRDR